MSFDETTINPWISQPGPIELRRSPRVPVPHDGAGIIAWPLLALNALVWGYVIARAFG